MSYNHPYELNNRRGNPLPAPRPVYAFRPRLNWPHWCDPDDPEQGVWVSEITANHVARAYEGFPPTQRWLLQEAPQHALDYMKAHLDMGQDFSGTSDGDTWYGDKFRLRTLPTPTSQDVRDISAMADYVKQLDRTSEAANVWCSRYLETHGGALPQANEYIQRYCVIYANRCAALVRRLMAALPHCARIYTDAAGQRFTPLSPAMNVQAWVQEQQAAYPHIPQEDPEVVRPPPPPPPPLPPAPPPPPPSNPNRSSWLEKALEMQLRLQAVLRRA